MCQRSMSTCYLVCSLLYLGSVLSPGHAGRESTWILWSPPVRCVHLTLSNLAVWLWIRSFQPSSEEGWQSITSNLLQSLQNRRRVQNPYSHWLFVMFPWWHMITWCRFSPPPAMVLWFHLLCRGILLVLPHTGLGGGSIQFCSRHYLFLLQGIIYLYASFPCLTHCILHSSLALDSQ